MSKSQRDKKNIALNQVPEVRYLKLIAKEIVLKTKDKRGYVFINSKGKNKDFKIQSISIKKINRLARAVLKALKYKRIDPIHLEPIKRPIIGFTFFILAVFVAGMLASRYLIPIIGGWL